MEVESTEAPSQDPGRSGRKEDRRRKWSDADVKSKGGKERSRRGGTT